jgi:2-amino-4-hydroxy-6-hydroxymethyldihydropteridine diphosphokinase
LGEVRAMAPILMTPPLGPSQRLFANGAMLVASPLPPEAMLDRLKQIERRLGRQRRRRWGARRMDIDIILWSGGRWNSRMLQIPHPAFRSRSFVLTPLRAIAPTWRDPISGLSVRQLDARLRKATALLRPRG